MNNKALYVLEYKKIIELLQQEAGSSLCRENIEKLVPETNKKVIEEMLRSTTEAVDLIVRKGPLPTGGLYDIEKWASFAKKGGSLTPKQLLEVAYNVGIALNVIKFIKGKDLPKMPILQSMIELIVPLENLRKSIDNAIETEDEIKDTASTLLRNIRRDIQRQNEAIKVKLNTLVNKSENRLYLQEAIVTIRDGRYVIPVKQEYRGKFPGLIHDQSKGGQTLFIEPQVVVNLNNQLRQLEIDEKNEIARILAELSSMVGEDERALRNNQQILMDLDFIMAKGKLSCKMEGQMPEISSNSYLKLVDARHPLLDPKKVVPLNVELGEDYTSLIITGPNTGGKTVALKTVGLLALMVQSGLHIPASSSSIMPIFSNVFADIGDEQSIEQSLSTFSSHLKNIVSILEEADSKSLVLLDELGAGTDPTEGAALAISILENLYSRGSLVLATTHYNELKKYALTTEGVENGSMEFSVETLSPSYKLLIGVPGKSNAFEISRKLGLDEDIITRATYLIKGKDLEFENVVSAIEEDKRRAERERDEANRLYEEAKIKKKEMEHALDKVQGERNKIINKAKAEARKILKDAKELTKETEKKLRGVEKISSLGKRTKELSQIKSQLSEKENKYAQTFVVKTNNEPIKAEKLKLGDKVKLLTLDQVGEILTLPNNKGDFQVKIGMMKINANLKDIILVDQGPRKKVKENFSKYSKIYSQKAKSVRSEVNVQGKNLDDALIEVEKYLDDAYIAGLKTVTIVHGRGEGILKKGIRDLLKSSVIVEGYKAGKYNEGGEGVTIVTLNNK